MKTASNVNLWAVWTVNQNAYLANNWRTMVPSSLLDDIHYIYFGPNSYVSSEPGRQNYDVSGNLTGTGVAGSGDGIMWASFYYDSLTFYSPSPNICAPL